MAGSNHYNIYKEILRKNREWYHPILTSLLHPLTYAASVEVCHSANTV